MVGPRRVRIRRTSSRQSGSAFKSQLYRRTLTMEQVRKIHESRSEKAQKIDEALEARITADSEKWAKAPNKWDIRGVDFPVSTDRERAKSLNREV